MQLQGVDHCDKLASVTNLGTLSHTQIGANVSLKVGDDIPISNIDKSH